MTYKRLERTLIQLKSVDSTNNFAATLLKTSKLTEGTVIMAEEQHHGRGQRSNVWTTEAGKNLTVSIVFYPQLKASMAFQLNIFVSLAVRKSLESFGIQAVIKWPNDILVNEKKIAGILIDNQLAGDKIKSSIVGIGLNVNQTEFGNLSKATSLKILKDKSFDLLDVLDELYLNLDFYYDLLKLSNFKLLLKHYYENLYRYRETYLFEDAKGQFQGEIIGIDQSGRLKIRREGRVDSYDIKEITYG